ncbi:MAG: DUF2341 domain-containing protein [Euryarchaeota archaeon]|nr:DUF2341 domain-containing protein [Euryarchaeota archaeon]MBU4340161.1 DUF2341 domain-containing protein [Euryarchaeota archaeon]MCG2735305.1 DUF2341 domain-containing protein [Candidatus Methanoperedenaceae archaeon]
MNLKTVLYVCFALIVLSGAASATTMLSNSSGGAWKYQKDIYVIENSGSSLTDYQVMVELKGSDFPAEAKSGGADIRFTNADGVELSYWIEEWNSAGRTARIWMKVPEIIPIGNTKITMHYGNPSATSSSNGDATFDFFDDFNGTRLNTNKWLFKQVKTTRYRGTVVMPPTSTIYGGRLTVDRLNILVSTYAFTPPMIIEANLSFAINPTLYKTIFSTQTMGDEGDTIGFETANSNEMTSTANSSDKSNNIVNMDGKEKVHTMKWRSEDVIFQTSYSTVAIHTKGIPVDPLYIHFINQPDFIAKPEAQPKFNIVVDWVRARKYAFPEPLTVTGMYINKSAFPGLIKPLEESEITVYLKNYGDSDITDIEVSDSVPKKIDLAGGDFHSPKKFDILRQGETKEIRYKILSKETGSFTLEPGIVTYTDKGGNIRTSRSEPVKIEVGSTSGRQEKTSGTTASVSLHGEKTDVVLGEDILLKLSAVNLINKPKMHLQVIMIPPSGMSVTSSEFSKSGAGQFTADYELAPGDGRDIEVRIQSNQIGDFNVSGRIVYYFGDSKGTSEDYILDLPIKVHKENSSAQETPAGEATPGFEAVLGISGLLFAIFLIKKRE